MGGPLLKAREVAQMMGVTTARIYQLLADGTIPSIKIGRSVRVPRTAWEAWMRGLAEEATANARVRRAGA